MNDPARPPTPAPGPPDPSDPDLRPRVTIGGELRGSIDRRLFGQFLERAAWGNERGPEAAMDPDAAVLRREVLDLLERDTPAVIRFPGGNDVDRTDWRDLVDGAHGRPGRPADQTVRGNTSTTRFGYDEFLRLSERLGFEPLLVLNLRGALLKVSPVGEAAERAAALVAYATAPLDADLPPGMKAWAELRAANGHPEPYDVPWVQIGNETWWPHKVKHVQDTIGSDDRDDYLAWYRTCLRAYIPAVRAVNPAVKLIVDGLCGLGIEEQVLRDQGVRDHVSAVALHSYSPWSFDELNLDGERLAIDAIDTEAWWRLFASCPGACDARGANVAWRDEELDLYRELGLRVGVTEWNWFGKTGKSGPLPMDLAPAMLTGAANFLHGVIRRSDIATLACQSMLMGVAWPITGIRVDPEGHDPPYYLPQYTATTTYARFCGTHRLDCQVEGVGGYEQPYATGNGMARPHRYVSWVDAVATAGATRTTLFLLNRRHHEPITLTIDPGPRHAGGARVHAHVLQCIPPDQRQSPYDAARVTAAPIRGIDGSFEATLPPAAVTILQIEAPSL